MEKSCYTLFSMEYKFATERSNYTDLASGRVFYSLPGHPAFPIRLASEVFQRCLALRGDRRTPCTIYDPCCGAAYHLSVIAYLHWDMICQVICSDISEKAVQIAERNLGLLTPGGMERRSREIAAMVRLYNKDSHKNVLESLSRMHFQLLHLAAVRPIQTHVFQANAIDSAKLREGLKNTRIDVVFSDVPYGLHSFWEQTPSTNPIGTILETLLEFLSPGSIVAICSDKNQKVAHEKYMRLDKFQLGKRRVVFLRPS
jgi:23S rRNA (guanine2535-N1)-methyltransferase